MSFSMPKSSLSVMRCRPCQPTSLLSRYFSTTPSWNAIGPESPKWIAVPTTPQKDAAPYRDIKGILPPPRNLFPNRGPDKVSEDYLASVAREPSKKSEPPNDYVAWKRRMAASRRSNLVEGLIELNKRKISQQTKIAEMSSIKRRVNEARLRAPRRTDERLTNPTIRKSVSSLQKGLLPDPAREKAVAKKAMRVQAKEAAREALKMDSLHTLYMNARSFITTEEQLNATIEEIFTDPFDADHPGYTNIWDKGAPPTVQELLTTVNHTERTNMQYHAGPAVITGKRMKKIAEELTGGKMD